MSYSATLAAEVAGIETTLLGTQTIYNNSVQRQFSIAVTGDVPPTWETTSPLPNATGGSSYSQTLVANSPYTLTYTVTSGTLPSGLTLNATSGVLSGTAPDLSTNQTYRFNVTANDSIQQISQPFSLTVVSSSAPVWVTPAGALTEAIGGVSYSYALQVTSSLSLTFGIVSGMLPLGLNLNTSTGVISGVPVNPSSTKTYDFTINVSDGTNNVSRAFSIEVAANLPPAWITPAGALPNALGGISYSETLVAQSTVPPTYAISSGELPPGLSLASATGVISGTPSNLVGSLIYNFTVGATNTGNTVYQSFSIDLLVNRPPVWNTPAGAISTNFFLNAQSNFQFSATDPNSQTLTYTLDPTTPLPAGLSLSSTGLLSGTPTGPTGTFTFNVIVSNGFAQTPRSFSSNVYPAETGIHVMPDEVTSNTGDSYTVLVTANQSFLDTVSFDPTTSTATVTSTVGQVGTHTYLSTGFTVTVNTD